MIRARLKTPDTGWHRTTLATETRRHLRTHGSGARRRYVLAVNHDGDHIEIQLNGANAVLLINELADLLEEDSSDN